MTFPYLALGAMGTAAIAYVLARVTRQYLAAAVAGSGVMLLLHGALYFHYTSDDAYISYRYARNFAEGAGLVWNRGEWVEGYTNFLWILSLAGLHRAGADIPLSARWLGFGLSVVAAAGAYVLATSLLDGARGRAAGLAAALLLAASGVWAAWSTAGLESPMLAALVLAGAILHVREQRSPALPASGAVWALSALARPDGLVFAAVSGAFKAGESVSRLRDGGATFRALAREAGRLALWCAAFAAVFVPYFVWRYRAYGWFFPNTYYAKVGSGMDQYERGLNYLSAFNEEYAAWLLLLAPLAVALTSLRRGPALYVLALVVAWLAYVVYVGGDSLARLRFFAPVLPLYYALIASSGAAVIATLAAGRPRWLVEATTVVAVGGLLAFSLRESAGDFALPEERQAVHERVEMGRWLHDNVPRDTVIAVIPAGAIPYEADLETIDMLGLNDEHIAHRDLALGKFPAGHEKYDSQYVLDRRPDIIILTDSFSADPWPWSRYTTVFLNTAIPARVDIVRYPQLQTDYLPRAVLMGPGQWFNMLVRRDARAVLARTQPAVDLSVR